MKLLPIQGYVLIKRSGPSSGEVLSMSADLKYLSAWIGRKVMFSHIAGIPVFDGGDELVLVASENLTALVCDEPEPAHHPV